jgi:hypothetical protein
MTTQMLPLSETVYISGPVSLGGTCTPEEIEEYSARFYKAETALQHRGYDVINPCRCEPQNTWANYMKIHIPSVCRSNFLVMLPFWEKSRGALLEAFIANQLSIPIYTLQDIFGNDKA